MKKKRNDYIAFSHLRVSYSYFLFCYMLVLETAQQRQKLRDNEKIQLTL